jgi:hypothetical protein
MAGGTRFKCYFDVVNLTLDNVQAFSVDISQEIVIFGSTAKAVSGARQSHRVYFHKSKRCNSQAYLNNRGTHTYK